DADDVLFDYINKRVKELHNKKAKFEESLRNQARKHKKIDTSPLTDPLKNWDDLSTREKHDVAMTMIDVIYLSDETGIDIHFSI
ncbi:MAG: resolvase, partial [Firmicutes bacterium]|nr:resolvase [Bacillota bacterium]